MLVRAAAGVHGFRGRWSFGLIRVRSRVNPFMMSSMRDTASGEPIPRHSVKNKLGLVKTPRWTFFRGVQSGWADPSKLVEWVVRQAAWQEPE
jgi:3-methyladenine DNA glycosylase AlkC